MLAEISQAMNLNLSCVRRVGFAGDLFQDGRIKMSHSEVSKRRNKNTDEPKRCQKLTSRGRNNIYIHIYSNKVLTKCVCSIGDNNMCHHYSIRQINEPPGSVFIICMCTSADMCVQITIVSTEKGAEPTLIHWNRLGQILILRVTRISRKLNKRCQNRTVLVVVYTRDRESRQDMEPPANEYPDSKSQSDFD